MALKLPTQITLLGKKINIKYVDELPENVHGLYHESDDLIEIVWDKPEFMVRVLFHEIMHATLAISGVNQLLNLKTEESICTMAENLCVIMKLDPKSKAVKWKRK